MPSQRSGPGLAAILNLHERIENKLFLDGTRKDSNFKRSHICVTLFQIEKCCRAGYHDSHAWNRSLDDYAHMVNDALMRYLGSLDEAARDCRAEMHNPFIWLREGTRILIAIPFNLLSWFGILGSATVSGITASHAFKAIAGITGLVGFVGMVAGLIVDVPDVPEAWSKILSLLGL
jgi:hypothetical protein